MLSEELLLLVENYGIEQTRAYVEMRVQVLQQTETPKTSYELYYYLDWLMKLSK